MKTLKEVAIEETLDAMQSEGTNLLDNPFRLGSMMYFECINEARKLVCAQARPEECEEIYRWLYDNLDIISKDEDNQDKAVLIIKQGLVDHSFVADPEINLASVMIKLARLSNG